MGEVIRIDVWRIERVARPGRASRAASVPGRSVVAAPIVVEGPVARLERAVARIDRVTARVQARGGRLAADVETELLALVGQISLGLVDEAAARAEHLADVLGGASSSGT